MLPLDPSALAGAQSWVWAGFLVWLVIAVAGVAWFWRMGGR